MLFCLYVCLFTVYVLGAYRGQKRASDPLGLELMVVVSCHAGPASPAGEGGDTKPEKGASQEPSAVLCSPGRTPHAVEFALLHGGSVPCENQGVGQL